MKLSEIRPCDACGGPIAPVFNIVRCSSAIFNADAVNSTLGLNQIFGGHALKLAEAMGSCADKAVLVAGDSNPELTTELLLCQECFSFKELRLGTLAEDRVRKV